MYVLFFKYYYLFGTRRELIHFFQRMRDKQIPLLKEQDKHCIYLDKGKTIAKHFYTFIFIFCTVNQFLPKFQLLECPRPKIILKTKTLGRYLTLSFN